MRSLKIINPPVCVKCGKAVEHKAIVLCNDCKERTREFVENKALLLYEGEVKNAMYDLKYANKRDNAYAFACLMVKRFGKYIKALDIEAIVPIPIHEKRLKQRGYNQAGVIADHMGKALDIKVLHDYLIREQDTMPQKELNDQERKNNMKNAFKVVQNDKKFGRILLIDDIYTTGSTLSYAARALKCAGVKDVYSMTVCIGKGC
ncbi:MAG: ComF family protein [Lachnospiraceae bacterium]|nr:ComF family protein [Lachnospiraceae bacterium]